MRWVSVSRCWFCSSSFWITFHWWSESTSRFASARFWEIITNVERKIASSETIIVSRPNGYFSTRKPIQRRTRRRARRRTASSPRTA